MHFELEALGWKSFQDLSLSLLKESFNLPVQDFAAVNDGGRDGAAILLGWGDPELHRHRIAIQCKHSSQSGRLEKRLYESEYSNIQRLLDNELCDVYYFVTNLRVSGRTDQAIQQDLRSLGVSNTIIIGRQTIERTLTENKALRALVPRVYGLGDLSEIIDERIYAQTNKILKSYAANCFVPTRAYFDVLSALHHHSFAILLGEPGAGKSSIMASAGIHAADFWNAEPMWLSHVREFRQRWNPNRNDQFFLIDDAFGTTSLDMYKVEIWNGSLPLMKTAIGDGNRFLLTSRDYVFSDARLQLKQYEVPTAVEREIIIDAEDLSVQERKQILYNHLKHGGQSPEFLAALKPNLDRVTNKSEFLPVAAARLADPDFTSSLDASDVGALTQFLLEPRSFLKYIIGSLEQRLQSTLILLMTEGGSISSVIPSEMEGSETLERLDLTRRSLAMSLESLEGSFLRLTKDGRTRRWELKHPTILDALGDWLLEHDDLLDIYLKFAPLQNLVAQVSCGEYVRGAVELPEELWDDLLTRLLSDEETSELAIRFLAYRCADAVLTSSATVQRFAVLLERRTPSVPLESDPGVRLFLRFDALNLLDQQMIESLLRRVIAIAVEQLDPYPLNNPQFLEICTFRTPTVIAWTSILSDYLTKLDADLSRYVSDAMSHYLGEVAREDVFVSLLSLMDAIQKELNQGHNLVKKFEVSRKQIQLWCDEPHHGRVAHDERIREFLKSAFGIDEEVGEDIFSDVDAEVSASQLRSRVDTILQPLRIMYQRLQTLLGQQA